MHTYLSCVVILAPSAASMAPCGTFCWTKGVTSNFVSGLLFLDPSFCSHPRWWVVHCLDLLALNKSCRPLCTLYPSSLRLPCLAVSASMTSLAGQFCAAGRIEDPFCASSLFEYPACAAWVANTEPGAPHASDCSRLRSHVLLENDTKKNCLLGQLQEVGATPFGPVLKDTFLCLFVCLFVCWLIIVGG